MNPIRKAMERLPGHWLKGATRDGKGNACGLGHLGNIGLNFNYDIGPAITIMEETAIEQYPDRVDFETLGDSPFGNFNDHPDTTEEEVLRVMEKAAIKWDEQA